MIKSSTQLHALMDKGLTSFTFLFMAGSFIIAVKGKAIVLHWQYTLISEYCCIQTEQCCHKNTILHVDRIQS